jgi:hypothetical protein
MAKCIKTAGTTKLTSEGRHSRKKSLKATNPFCHTISVVMSPKGENAPPALAATTILMHPVPMNFLFSLPTASSTAHRTSAVVRLSRTGDNTKASPPVNQKSFR